MHSVLSTSAHRAYGPLIERNDAGKELTLVAIIRAAARACSSPIYRHTLNVAADQVDAASRAYADNPTTTNMQALCGAWAHGVAIYEGRPNEAPPNPPLSGAPEPAKLAA